MTIEQLPDGDLLVTWDGDAPETEDEVREYLERQGYLQLRPERIGALTSAPLFTDDAALAGLDDPILAPRPDAGVWWYPDYVYRLMNEDLRDTGKLLLPQPPQVEGVAA